MNKGFTLIELILVMGITSLLIALGSVSFFSSYKSTNLNAATEVLIADLRSQQSRAMSGESLGGSPVDSWGIKINADSYTLFANNYDQSNQNNRVVDLPDGYALSSTFPSSGQIKFARGTGEIIGFINGQDTITLSNLGSNRIIELNPYGIIIGD